MKRMATLVITGVLAGSLSPAQTTTGDAKTNPAPATKAGNTKNTKNTNNDKNKDKNKDGVSPKAKKKKKK